MHITFVSFNFKGTDLAAEEKHYLDYHVALAKSFPRVSLYLTARMRPADGVRPDRLRAAIMGFDSVADSVAAIGTEASMKVLADTQEHLTDMRLEAFEAEVVVPFEKAKAGTSRFVLAAAFDFKPDQGDLASAERIYRERHVPIACKLPQLKGYMVARLAGERQRIAILMFDDVEHYREAMESPAGIETAKDRDATFTNIRFETLDARQEV